MWIADELERLRRFWTASKGEKLERWGDYLSGSPGPPGDLEHPQKFIPVGKRKTAITTAAKKAAASGNFFDLP